jgi:2-oxoglutarate ferredoxin oxidoreductase subunit beta
MGNNMVYGMTGGQVAPTTPLKTRTTTTPYGSFEYPLDAAKLAVAAGAAYSARWTTAHPTELKESIKKALQLRGFRFIEAVTQCPTAYGRRAGFKNIGEMLKYFKENSVPVEKAKRMSEEELERKIAVGEFVHRERPTLVEAVYSVLEEAKKSVEQD